tara:strand:- start:120 stop:620 length:501 start_codon:yes stop_codon:yes gene_type:complete
MQLKSLNPFKSSILRKPSSSASNSTMLLYRILYAFVLYNFIVVMSFTGGIKLIFGDNFSAIISNLLLYMFFSLSIFVFFKRKKLRLDLHNKTYKALTGMIKIQLVSFISILSAALVYIFSNSEITDAGQIQAISFGPIATIIISSSITVVFAFGLIRTIMICRKFS